MILRTWRAKVVPAHMEEYQRFAQERCLPMLRKQPGFLGVFFLRGASDAVVSITIWEDRGTVEALESSPSYRRTDRELSERGLLASDQSVEILEVEGGDFRPEALLGALDNVRRADSSGS